MTQEQGEALQIWCIKTIAKHNLDYFRGSVLVEVVEYISVGGSHRVMRAIKICQGAKRLNFGVYPNIFDFLLEDLRQIAKEVPLSNEEMTAITCILYGKWEEVTHAIFKLKSSRNEQR